MRVSLIDRVCAAESTAARFTQVSFAWGSIDCVRMVAYALRELDRPPPLRQAGAYTTYLGARRALKRTGHATLEAWVDAWGLVRIPPATVLPADVLALPGEGGDWPALALVLGNGRVFGFSGGVGAVFALTDPHAPLVAWSV